MPIFERSNFYIKYTYNYFVFLIQNCSKILSAPTWLVSRHAFKTNGLPHRALNTWNVNFSQKYTLFEFWFCGRYCRTNLKFVILGQLGDTPICLNQPTFWGPNYISWHFFHKTDTLSICILCGKLIKNFKIGPIGADWQISHLAENGPLYGAPNTGVGNFFYWSPLNLDCVLNCWEILILVYFVLIGRPPYLAKIIAQMSIYSTWFSA